MVKRPLLLFLTIPINRPLCSHISHLRKNHFCYPLWIPYPNLATSPFFCSLSKKMLRKSFLHSPSPILHSLGCISIRLFPTTPPDMLLSRSPSDLHIPGQSQFSTTLSDTDGPLPPAGDILSGWLVQHLPFLGLLLPHCSRSQGPAPPHFPVLGLSLQDSSITVTLWVTSACLMAINSTSMLIVPKVCLT